MPRQDEDVPVGHLHWENRERELYDNVMSGGEGLTLGGGDSSEGEGWGAERTIRAAVIRRLLTDRRLAGRIVRLRLTGAKIVGELDFEAATLNATLDLVECHLAEVVNLDQASAPGIFLERCHLAGLHAAQVRTETNLSLGGSTCAYAGLAGAQIKGQLALNDAVFSGRRAPGVTLNLSGVRVGSDTILSGSTVKGLTNMIGARIGGQLVFNNATLDAHGAEALAAKEMKIAEDVYFIEGFSADGSVDLTGTKIVGKLDFGNAAFRHCGQKSTLDLSRVHVEQDLHFGDGFTAQGIVSLVGASIDGNLNAGGAQFRHPADTAIDARGLHARDVNLSTATSHVESNCSGFLAEGKIVLADSVINGTLDCRGGSVSRPRSDEDALDARGMEVTRDLLLGKGFTASGTVNLTGTEVGGRAVLSDGTFENADQCAIMAQQLTVRTCLLLEGDFLAKGLVDLTAASVGQLKVGGQVHLPDRDALILDSVTVAQNVDFSPGLIVEGTLRMRGARIGSHARMIKPNLGRGLKGVVLDLKGTAVTGALRLKADTPVGGKVDLRQASVGLLDDDLAFWPKGKNETRLADFTYVSLSDDLKTRNVDTRIAWLKSSVYSAQIYEQLGSVYRAGGRPDLARDVMYSGQKERPSRGRIGRFWSTLLRWTIGYGYNPERVLVVLVALEIFGTVFFSIGRSDLKPSDTLVVAYGGEKHVDAAARAHLQPALYTLDLLLPVVSLGQRALWLPLGVVSWVAALLMILGWVLGGILVYGISMAYQRRSS